MKVIIGLILLVFSSYLCSEEFKTEDWLLWYKVETQLPFYSALTTYPPVNLFSENGELRGAIAAPYSLSGNDNRVIEEYLIVVTDDGGNTHFLKPKLQSVGFVNDKGISMSTLRSSSFLNGKVLVQLYKLNSHENRQKLKERESNDLKKKQGVENALANINIPKPKLDEVWKVKASTLDGQHLDKIVASSAYTIVQLYSPYCGFSKKAIPFNNVLNNAKHISVIGMAGTESLNDFKKHLKTKNVQYSFIAYEGQYTESALLKSVGQQGFPTYFVLDSFKKVRGIFVGTPALESWLKAQAL